jgi:hypothetical protein
MTSSSHQPNTIKVNEMKEWTCVQVNHHNKIAEVIILHQNAGWKLHTYQTVGTPTMVNHYLLFEREK